MANNFFQHIFLMLQTVIVYIANLILYVANIILWCCDKQVWWWVFPSDVRTISTPCSIISHSDTLQTQYSGPRRHKAGPVRKIWLQVIFISRHMPSQVLSSGCRAASWSLSAAYCRCLPLLPLCQLRARVMIVWRWIGNCQDSRATGQASRTFG